MGMSLSDVSVPAEILYAENRKLVDAEAKRYFAVFDPMKISITSVKQGKESDNVVSAPSHPGHSKHGKRQIPINKDVVFVEKKDYEKLKGEDVGLMNLCSVKLGEKSEFLSRDISIDAPKIHWVSEPNVEAEIVMPNGDVKNVLIEPDIEKAKIGDIIQLVRVGFCRVDKVGKGGKDTVLYFAHK